MYLLARLISMTVAYCALVALIQRVVTLALRIFAARNRQKPIQIYQRSTQTRPGNERRITREVVTPLANFDHRKQEPNKYRPFRSNRHVIMGELKMGIGFPTLKIAKDIL